MVYDFFDRALFNDEFGIYEHSMGMIEGPNYLYAISDYGQVSMQHVNPGSTYFNDALNVPDFGSNFVRGNHDQLTNAIIPCRSCVGSNSSPS